MLDKNKSPNQRDDLLIAPKKCKECNEDIKKEMADQGLKQKYETLTYIRKIYQTISTKN